MSVPKEIERLSNTLPDSEGAKRLYSRFAEEHPKETKKLQENTGLLSDVLTIAAFSPLLATTILQNPQYLTWLEREKRLPAIREKDELLESLARFALTNSLHETNVLLSRFRRRELIRIYLKDIRRLSTIAEITEEISNLADSILEFALKVAIQELDNRFGMPLELDENGRSSRAKFCIVALGKLGSKELNYSSDIDLLFLYSDNGSTSGQGSRAKTSNRQYFVKLAQTVSNLVGEQTGEGAAYRVDLRLRPNGRVGALAISKNEAIKYYRSSSQMWERQVLIRSRSSAGDSEVFQYFFDALSPKIFSVDETVANALSNVLHSKQKIDIEKVAKNGFDVKLGKGGIREIEFIAQALQLAYGGADPWLRSPHTLISLSRLADRKLITETELTELFEAYDFLRRLEHRLQMEQGLQTHLLTFQPEKRELVSKRMDAKSLADFDETLKQITSNVSAAFKRIFGTDYTGVQPKAGENIHITGEQIRSSKDRLQPILSSLEKSENRTELAEETLETLKLFSEISPPFSAMIAANPNLINELPLVKNSFTERDYHREIVGKVSRANSFAQQLAVLRRLWAKFIIEIAAIDIFGKKSLKDIKRLQTSLAEACIEAAVLIAERKLEVDFNTKISDFPFAVLALGKLGGGGIDYGSDLDLLLVYDDEKPCPVNGLTRREFYAKAVELFVTALSSLTREGSLYRVDLRLRPDGKNGATSIGKLALLNYLKDRAAIWEWLAYVKLRAVAGDMDLAESTEAAARNLIHENASQINFRKIRDETYRIRKRLEKSKLGNKKGKEIDIKFGKGGLQDVYFAIRYLQLRDNVPDDKSDRSTTFSLERLHKNNSLAIKDFENFSNGYKFLSELDHNVRLTIGRSTRLPIANQSALSHIADRMNFESVNELLEHLTFHRLNNHSSFESSLNSRV